MVDDTFNGVVWLQLVGTNPKAAHEERELLCVCSLLEVETVVELASGHFEDMVELGEEHLDALFLVFNAHALDGKTHNVDGTEGKVATPNGSLWTKTIFVHAGATSHRCHFVIVTMRVIGTPLLTLVVGGIEVEEVREETTGSDLASQLIEVVVAVLRQIVHTTLFLPNLNREDGGLTIAHTFERALQQFAHDATSFGTCVGSVIDGRENHLIATARVDGVHVVDEGFHCLVNT